MDIKNLLNKAVDKAKELKQDTPATQTNDENIIVVEEDNGGIMNTVVNIVLVLAIVLAIVCTYVSFVSTSGSGVPSILGIRPFSIQTESMYPTLMPGDLIIDSAVTDTEELEVGDIITYWTIINGERVLNTHRISEIYDGGGYLIFETKGDNNTAADALTVHESEIVGIYTGTKLNGVGKVFDYLQTSNGFLIVVVIPVAIFFLYHLIQFFRILFEYNNIKNKLQYELERGKTEDLLEDEKKKLDDTKRQERERLEQELRDKLKAELLAANAPAAPKADVVEEKKEEPVTEEVPVEPVVEKVEVEAPAEESKKTLEETRAEMEAKIRAELEAEAKAKAEAEAKAKEEAEAKAKAEAEAKAKAEAEAKAKAEAEAKMRAEMEAKIRAELEAEAKAKEEAEAKAKAEAEARAAMEAEIRAKILAEMEAEAKAKAEPNENTEA